MKKELEINAEKYMCGIMCVKEIIEEYDAGSGKVQAIDFRIKSADSIAEKLEKKGYEVTTQNAENYLNDLAGVRVICFSEEEIYLLEHYLCTCDAIVIVKKKDYIKSPKKSGYRSLHLIVELCEKSVLEKVRVEIQIRTEGMHRWATEDHKQFYKKLTNKLPEYDFM